MYIFAVCVLNAGTHMPECGCAGQKTSWRSLFSSFYCRIQGSNLLSHLTGLINLLLLPDFCLLSPSSAVPFGVVTQWGLREVSQNWACHSYRYNISQPF